MFKPSICSNDSIPSSTFIHLRQWRFRVLCFNSRFWKCKKTIALEQRDICLCTQSEPLLKNQNFRCPVVRTFGSVSSFNSRRCGTDVDWTRGICCSSLTNCPQSVLSISVELAYAGTSFVRRMGIRDPSFVSCVKIQSHEF